MEQEMGRTMTSAESEKKASDAVADVVPGMDEVAEAICCAAVLKVAELGWYSDQMAALERDTCKTFGDKTMGKVRVT